MPGLHFTDIQSEAEDDADQTEPWLDKEDFRRLPLADQNHIGIGPCSEDARQNPPEGEEQPGENYGSISQNFQHPAGFTPANLSGDWNLLMLTLWTV